MKDQDLNEAFYATKRGNTFAAFNVVLEADEIAEYARSTAARNQLDRIVMTDDALATL